MSNESVFQATFVGIKQIKNRAVCQFILEVDETMADECLRRIGGLPRASESRFVAIARLDPLATEFPVTSPIQAG
jgi:hypothetical protein